MIIQQKDFKYSTACGIVCACVCMCVWVCVYKGRPINFRLRHKFNFLLTLYNAIRFPILTCIQIKYRWEMEYLVGISLEKHFRTIFTNNTNFTVGSCDLCACARLCVRVCMCVCWLESALRLSHTESHDDAANYRDFLLIRNYRNICSNALHFRNFSMKRIQTCKIAWIVSFSQIKVTEF